MTANPSTQLDSILPSLPEGYTQRAATFADAERVGRVYTAAYQSRGQDETFTAEYFKNDWESPKWDLETSSQVFFNAQGDMIACVTVWDQLDANHPWMEWEISPDDNHWQAVVRALMAWAEQRAQQALVRCQPEERFAPVTGYDASRPEIVAFVESLGYQPIRYFYRMGITMTEAPTVLDLPTGFTLKTFEHPAELEALVAAKDEMWQDHYGYVPTPLTTLIENWRHAIESDKKFDASMWYIATDDATGEIAGLVLARPEDYTKVDQGYILIVGVRRAYRKRGLAQAMLTHAFAEYWTRGQKMVALGVDASNPTGAVGLYERVGMSPVQRFVRLEKEMRPGIERMNMGT